MRVKQDGPEASLWTSQMEAIMKLQAQRLVILGGTSGIGLAVARAAAAEGASVIVASRRPERVQASLPPGVEARELDLLAEDAVRDFFEALGPFDHLAYTAGDALQLRTLDETEPADARRFFELRYWGALTAVRHGHRRIRPGGSIVLTSGSAGARPRSGWTLAASICGAMEGLTRALAAELAPLRVNLVSPGVVRTPLWDGMDAAARAALYASEALRLPVGHVGDPAEIAEGYLYLMRQTYMTGQTLAVDGGGALAA
jgi:NAD(P)-dependent dehydrogenase (short-subunit alcohol dehydrogenase family)